MEVLRLFGFCYLQVERRGGGVVGGRILQRKDKERPWIKPQDSRHRPSCETSGWGGVHPEPRQIINLLNYICKTQFACFPGAGLRRLSHSGFLTQQKELSSEHHPPEGLW